MRTSSWALAGLTAAVLAAGPASTATAGLWSAPVDLAQDGISATGDIAVQSDGASIVAWAVPGGPVRTAARPADGVFDPVVTLAPDGGQAVSVALDGTGGTLVAWSRNGDLGLAERTSAGAPLTVLPTGVTGVASGPEVAFKSHGEAVVVWTGTDGAVHALLRISGGATHPLPDLAPGPGNANAHVDAAGGHAVAAWTHVATAGTQTGTHVRASAMPPLGAFGAAEGLATSSSDKGQPTGWSGSEHAARRVVVAGNGSADVLMTELAFLGPPGEVAMAGNVAARSMDAWAPAQRVGSADLALGSGQFTTDVAVGAAGDALYVEGAKNAAPTMRFSARHRAAVAAVYGEASTLHVGPLGQVLAAPLTTGRFLALMRSGAGLRSRAGNPVAGFDDPLVFTGTNGAALLGLAGGVSGRAAALWITTTGRIHAAVYDDSLGPSSLPPAVGPDSVAPVLSRLAVKPRRFTPHRRTRIGWRLSEPARVQMRVGRCLARPRSSRRCTRFRRLGTLTRVGQAGRTTVRFDPFVRRRGLLPGRYRIIAVPRDAMGNPRQAPADDVRGTATPLAWLRCAVQSGCPADERYGRAAAPEEQRCQRPARRRASHRRRRSGPDGSAQPPAAAVTALPASDGVRVRSGRRRDARIDDRRRDP